MDQPTFTSSHAGVNVAGIDPVEVGPGCTRRNLMTDGAISVWVVDMEPGSEWPYVDRHDEMGERLYVLSGELIEGSQRYGAGTYVVYGPHSTHRPRTESGVRMFGFNLIGKR